MNRRKFLAGVGASPTAPLLKINSGNKETGPVLFAQAHLFYRIESNNVEDVKSVHVDSPPEYFIRGSKIRTTSFLTEKTVNIMKNKSSIISYNGIKEFSENVPERKSIHILPVDCADRGQVTRGLVLDDKIEIPQFGIQKVPPKQIQVNALGKSIKLSSSEQKTLSGKEIEVRAKSRRAQNDSVKITATPVLSVSNMGPMMPHVAHNHK